MLHPERIDRGAEVIPDLLLLGIEADTLADDRWLGACGAPDGKGHFEADGEDSLAYLAGARTQSVVLPRGLVEG